MSETVDEFMQKPVKTYHCGKDAQRVKKTLTQAFVASSENKATEEKASFEKIIDAVMKTKEGRSTLKALADLGYTYAFERGKFGGFCNSIEKKIVINPALSFEYNVQTAVHEGRHAIQASLKSENVPLSCIMQTASYLRYSRAIEADASAHEAAFAYECKDILPEVYQEAKKRNAPMFKAYVDEMEKSGNGRKAMQASFAAWYEYDYYRDFYDNDHKNMIKAVCDWGKKHKYGDFFREEYSGSDALKLCVYRGKPYMTEEFLNTGKAFSISQKDKKDIAKMIKDYVKAVPEAKMDMSVLKMRERTASGELLPVQNDTAKIALAAKLKAQGR